MNIKFAKLVAPSAEITESFTKWENDPALIYLMRPNQTQADLDRRSVITLEELQKRLEHDSIYLIYSEGQLVGEMDYQMNPTHLYKQEVNTAWLGIKIGEESARGKGIGFLAIQFLERVIKLQNVKRIELGVFEFNTNAHKLYQKLGYQEIGRIPNFTFWQGKMWTDIRLEKYI